ncbi:hypothetical protein [Nocardioides sp. CFH 31398]|uniref:hypothetical protein n=1 Tax=Nocardioides sp. CFH 31398 TaxID=2919579 RepID=UPI001F06F9CD|nr:hypothetical protein [Nocardioides sp. CFH 31398]MCH1866920.1 hypothetical protein [Nocardioides sp. CFH 31398]
MLPSGPLLDEARRRGEVFATFAAQDSGHISFGVRDARGRRWFVKTSLDAAALRRTALLHAEASHPALLEVVEHEETESGAVLVQPWFDGELLRAPAGRRDHPAEAFARFRALPLPRLHAALDTVVDLHVVLEAAGWVAGDLYDGSLMHAFGAGRTVVVDLECYRRGPWVNDVGRLPGSTRFMAPEENRRGAVVDHRTTVFVLGRVLDVFLPSERRSEAVATVVRAATFDDPADRLPSVAHLAARWRAAIAEQG